MQVEKESQEVGLQEKDMNSESHGGDVLPIKCEMS